MAAATALVLYVSTLGNDNWSGRLPAPNERGTDGPLATLTRSRDVIRELKQAGGPLKGGVAVRVRGGLYCLEQAFSLSKEDSGTGDCPIVYEACQGEEVRLSGSRAIDAWEPVQDKDVLVRLEASARGRVMQANLRAQGVKDFGRLSSRGFGRPITPAALELFFRDEPMILARWPNEGFEKIEGFPRDQAQDDGHGTRIGKLEAGFFYKGDRPARWKSLEDVWIHGYWAYDWANSYEQVESIDLQRRLIRTRPPFGNYGFLTGQRFHVLNVLEELDSPGEWYLDRRAGILYFWPPEPIRRGDCVVSLQEQPLVSLDGASYVTLRGLTLECSRGHGVRIAGGQGNLLTACTLRNLGNYGVLIQGGSGHGVADCEVYRTGDGGVSVAGGDRKTLQPAGHSIHNNHIHHVALWSKCYVPAVLIEGVGIRVSHNLIHDHPHCAILFNGNDHVVEFNEVHHVCLETGDVGAIYTGRDWTYRGNVIRHNYIHHTGGVGMGSMGVYMDDCVSGANIFGNVFYQVHWPVFLGGGRDHRVENNVFVGCDPAVWLDDRGISKRPVWHDMVYQTMKKRLEEMNWRQPPYSTRYPELADLEKYYARDEGVPPENNLLARNICVDGELLQLGWTAQSWMIKAEGNLVGQDPLFEDAAKGNFQLRDGSPAWKLGFKRIPIEQIGPIHGRHEPQ